MAANFKLSTGVVYVRGWTGTVTAGTIQFADGTAPSPSISFASDPSMGFYRPGTNHTYFPAGKLLGVGAYGSGPSLVMGSGVAGLQFSSNAGIRWSSTTSEQGAADTILLRDAANTLAQQNGTNAQTERIYGTYTDSSNYERLNLEVLANAGGAQIYTQAAGTGTARPLRLGSGGTVQWQINTSGHLLTVTDNTYDIGASGATRPRNVYIAGTLTVGGTSSMGNVYVGGGNALGVASRLNIQAPSDGVATLSNGANTDFGRLQFGGTTSSFPALKRVGAQIQVRLGDDSGAGNFGAGAYFLGNSNVMVIASTAPTISSGFGTSPSIVASNGTAAFTVNVGTGGTASSGVITMPAATTGWNCSVENRTANAANRANQRTLQTATTTTTVTVQNQTVSTGAALAWTASDVLALVCMAY